METPGWFVRNNIRQEEVYLLVDDNDYEPILNYVSDTTFYTNEEYEEYLANNQNEE